MIMRSAKVPESPSSALQTTYFWSAAVCIAVRSLIPQGKPAPPRPRRPDSIDLIDDLRAAHRRGAPQTFVSAMRDVIVQRDRIDHAHAREGQSLLILEIGNLLGEPQA